MHARGVASARTSAATRRARSGRYSMENRLPSCRLSLHRDCRVTPTNHPNPPSAPRQYPADPPATAIAVHRADTETSSDRATTLRRKAASREKPQPTSQHGAHSRCDTAVESPSVSTTPRSDASEKEVWGMTGSDTRTGGKSACALYNALNSTIDSAQPIVLFSARCLFNCYM